MDRRYYTYRFMCVRNVRINFHDLYNDVLYYTILFVGSKSLKMNTIGSWYILTKVVEAQLFYNHLVRIFYIFYQIEKINSTGKSN